MRLRTAAACAVAAALVWPARRACPLEQAWMGPVPHYDYLRNITFERGGRGEMVYGYAQHVVCELRFSWRRDGDVVEIDARRIPVRVEKGRFVAPVDDYPEPTLRTFGCRVTFGEDPFPAGCGRGAQFYACPLESG
ncbi:MAG TPA: hypothetical protein VFF06_16120 [Polyangia bacterium]|nr:hypothetical protein [Polyangia bacterium]